MDNFFFETQLPLMHRAKLGISHKDITLNQTLFC